MQRRVQLAEWLEENPDVLDKLWSNDEALFYLSGEALQNEVHWGKERPDVVLNRPLHSQTVTVWLTMSR